MFPLIVACLVGVGFTRMTMFVVEYTEESDRVNATDPMALRERERKARLEMAAKAKPKILVQCERLLLPYRTEPATSSVWVCVGGVADGAISCVGGGSGGGGGGARDGRASGDWFRWGDGSGRANRAAVVEADLDFDAEVGRGPVVSRPSLSGHRSDSD